MKCSGHELLLCILVFVVVPRGDVHYIVTEYGCVNLFGKSIQQRVIAIISIAHPDFREALLEGAKELGFIDPERTIGEASRAVHPIRLNKLWSPRSKSHYPSCKTRR